MRCLRGGLCLYFLKKLEKNVRCLGVGDVLARSGQGLDCGIEFADAEQMVSEEELEIGVECVEVGLLGELVDVVEEFVVVAV